MAKKLSGWFRIFIVFAVVWTVVSVFFFSSGVPLENTKDMGKERLEFVIEAIRNHLHPDEIHEYNNITDLIGEANRRGLFDEDKNAKLYREQNWNGLADALISTHKERVDFSFIDALYKHSIRKEWIYMCIIFWLAPVGLVYGIGWGVGWIIKGFRKKD